MFDFVCLYNKLVFTLSFTCNIVLHPENSSYRLRESGNKNSSATSTHRSVGLYDQTIVVTPCALYEYIRPSYPNVSRAASSEGTASSNST